MLFRLNGETVTICVNPFNRFMQAFKRCAYLFKKKLHPFNVLTRTFKRFADPLKKIASISCIRENL